MKFVLFVEGQTEDQSLSAQHTSGRGNPAMVIMVMLKWTVDKQGHPVRVWRTEEPMTARAKQFPVQYRKAVRPAVKPRASARRHLLRAVHAIAATAMVE